MINLEQNIGPEEDNECPQPAIKQSYEGQFAEATYCAAPPPAFSRDINLSARKSWVYNGRAYISR